MKKIFETLLLACLMCFLILPASACIPKVSDETPADSFPNDGVTAADYALPHNFFINISVSDGGEELHMRAAKVGDDWETITDDPELAPAWRFYQWMSDNRYYVYLWQNDIWTYQKTVNFSGLMEDSAAALTFLVDPSVLPAEALYIEKARTTGLMTYETLQYTYTNASGVQTVIELEKYHPHIMLSYSCAGLVRYACNYNSGAGDWTYMHGAGEAFFFPPV